VDGMIMWLKGRTQNMFRIKVTKVGSGEASVLNNSNKINTELNNIPIAPI
jgi:hypothetical protein